MPLKMKQRFALLLVLLALFSSCLIVNASDTETINYKNLEIDLGSGITASAQLTYPSNGEGPYPCVLLIQGSGCTDMNGYIPSYATGTGTSTKPLQQIAEYLSERGMAVLRYNKRGVGMDSKLIDQDVFLNITFQALVHDAEKAFNALLEQEETDEGDVTLIGHSEGSLIAAKIACKTPGVKKIVLLGAVAHNLREILEYQVVERKAAYLEEVIDGDKDGLISINEVVSLGSSDIFLPVPDFTLIENRTGEWDWPIGLDSNDDGLMSINEEFVPRNLEYLEMLTSPEHPQFKWYESHFELEPTLSMIGNITCSVLLLHGKGDAQAQVQEAFLLQQRLAEVNHRDHLLITYPGLGHSFYPVDGWKQPLGPIQDYVLSDISSWITDPARSVPYISTRLQFYEEKIDETMNKLSVLDSELQSFNGYLRDILQLEKSLSRYRNLAFLAVGLSLFSALNSIRSLRRDSNKE